MSVVTGGPGGGKTTAAELFRREIGEKVVVVPEAATLLFSGGFPRVADEHARMSAQRAIYHVQRNLEDVQSSRFPDRILLCDRGSVDGAPHPPAVHRPGTHREAAAGPPRLPGDPRPPSARPGRWSLRRRPRA